MRKIFYLGLFFALSFAKTACYSQETITLYLNSGTELLKHHGNKTVVFSELESEQGYAYRVVVFESIEKLNKANLESNGITLLNYLPKNAFYAKIKTGYNNTLDFKGSILEIQDKWKQSPELYADFFPDHAILEGGDKYLIQLSIFDGEKVAVQNKIQLLNESKIVDEAPSFLSVVTSKDELENIKSFSEVFYICAGLPKEMPLNLPGKTSHGSSYLDGYNSIGANYDGNGITVMMTDDGYLNEHIDFKNRFDQSGCTNCSSSPNDAHGDHVAGTIMGAGNLDPYARGMATGINFFVEDATQGYGPYFTLMPTMYTNDSLVITSRSFGQYCSGGFYTNSSHDLDQQMNSLPNLLNVVAAGNDGTDECGYGVVGWGNVSNRLQATKNGLTVGALTANDVIAGFSSRGPAIDGRIKPEICGVGVGVYSTIPNNQYSSWQGTSMSTPGVSGTIAQLYEAFKDLNNGDYPTAGLMKAIVLNTANDLGNKGPDFIHGYGKINARKAYESIENKTYFIDSIITGNTDTYTISVPPNVSELRVMLYWPDFEGSPSASRALVNDLNLTVVDPNSTTLFPWVLDPTPNVGALSSPAIPGVDTLNNVEQITIDYPVAGNYDVNIDGFSVPEGPQVYYFVYEYNFDEIHVNYPNGNEGFDSPSNVIIRWDAINDGNDFQVDYTTDDGASWNSIATVPASDRFVNWNIPNGINTGEARIRVSKPGVSDISDTTFSIFNAPTGLTVNWSCPDSLSFAWDSMPGATSYVVYMLGNKYMDSIGTTTDTNYVLQIPAVDTAWLSVRAYGANGARSERAVAIQKLPGQFNCTWSTPIAGIDLSCDSLAVNNCVQVFNESINVDAGSSYMWYFPTGTPATSTDENPTVCFSTNGHHDAALVVTNSVGSDSVYYSDFVFVQNSDGIPYFEGFENITSFSGLESWSIYNPDNNAAFTVISNTALTGVKSARLYNHGQAEGSVDELISGPIDLSSLDPAQDIMTLSFRYAHRHRESTNDDWLRLYAKSSCDDPWLIRKTLHGPQLSTLLKNAPYSPADSSEWVTVHVVNILSSFFTSDFRFKFNFESGGGNNFYLDDINIYSGGPSDDIVIGLEEINDDFSYRLYPNPVENDLNVEFTLGESVEVMIELEDMNGRVVQKHLVKGSFGKNLVMMETASLDAGVYFVSLNLNGSSKTKRIIIQ